MLIVLVLLIVAFFVAVQWIIFSKAGRPGWAAIVPIYNIIVQLQVCKLSPWLAFVYLLSIIPIVGSIVGLVMSIIVSLRLAKVFGKGTGFAIGLIFLPFIFQPILAFGDAQYQFDEE